MKHLRLTALLALSCCVPAQADHASGAAWSWHVLSGGLDESRVAIYDQQELIGIFNFSCDLTEAEAQDGPASLKLVQSESNPDGLLIVTCNVGAHSQHIAIVDPKTRSNRPAFARTGSYFVNWEIESGELWISYDRPCGPGPSVECPDGYETLFVRYPEGEDESAPQ